MKQQELENELAELKQKGEEREETIRQLEEIKEKNKNKQQQKETIAVLLGENTAEETKLLKKRKENIRRNNIRISSIQHNLAD